MKRLSVHVVFGLLFLLLVSPSLAQQQTPAITAQQIKANTYLLKGGMALNTGAFIGAEEVVFIDAKMTEAMATEMIAEIRKLTPLPIGHIFLTHSDDDHVNGLLGFPHGPAIVSHEKARADMANLQNRTLSAIDKNFKEFNDQFNDQMPDLVMAIVGKVWESLKLTREDVLDAIDAALSQAGNDKQNLVIHLSKADADLLQDTGAFKSRYPNIAVETDLELKNGDVVIISRFGTIDCRVKTKLRRVGEEIAKAHK